jgi:hypothetical protein
MSFSPSFTHDPILGQNNIVSTSSYAMNEGSEAQMQSSRLEVEDKPLFTANEGGVIPATNCTSPSDASYIPSIAESFGSQPSGSSNSRGSLQSSASDVNSTVGTAPWINSFESSEDRNSQFPMTSAFINQANAIEEWTFGVGAANSYDMTSMPLNPPVQPFSNLGFIPDHK